VFLSFSRVSYCSRALSSLRPPFYNPRPRSLRVETSPNGHRMIPLSIHFLISPGAYGAGLQAQNPPCAFRKPFLSVRRNKRSDELLRTLVESPTPLASLRGNQPSTCSRFARGLGLLGGHRHLDSLPRFTFRHYDTRFAFFPSPFFEASANPRLLISLAGFFFRWCLETPAELLFPPPQEGQTPFFLQSPKPLRAVTCIVFVAPCRLSSSQFVLGSHFFPEQLHSDVAGREG